MNTWVFSSYYVLNMYMCVRLTFYSKTTLKVSASILNLEVKIDWILSGSDVVQQKDAQVLELDIPRFEFPLDNFQHF